MRTVPDTSVRQLHDTVRAARAGKRPAAGKRFDTVSVDEAYRIQADLFSPPVAWKLGLLSRAKQRQMGLTQPIYGRLTRGQVHTGRVRLGDFLQPRIEPELAAVLGHDLAPDATSAAATAAISHFVLAVDILDSSWQDYRFCAAEVIADNASGGAAVVGTDPVRTPDGSLAHFLDGRPLGAGDLADLGTPGEHLAWLATRVGGLRSGTPVLLGSPATSVPAHAGELVVRGAGRTLTVVLEP